MKTSINLIASKTSDIGITYQIVCNSIKPYIKKLWGWDDVHQQKIHQKKFKVSKTKLIQFEDQIVGFIVVNHSDNEIYLENLLIDQHFQNLGIGKEIMGNIIEKAILEMKTIRLQVFKINYRAQHFYERLGFKRISENEFNFEMKYYVSQKI